MIIDPHIAVIRTRPSLEFYDRVIARVFARDEQPRGVLMHYSAIYRDQIHVCTVFSDRVAMQEAFVNFSALEAENEMIASGVSFDLDRTEYELERLHVWPCVEPEQFSAKPAGSICAITSELLALSPTEYREIEKKRGWGEQDVPGRLAHLAFRRGESMFTTTFWESRAAGEGFYRRFLGHQVESTFPGRSSSLSFDKSWMDVHTFVVTLPKDHKIRDYAREHSGPSEPGS